MALAVNPPSNIPISPSLSICSAIPFHKLFPNPIRGTLAPAPAQSIKGCYKPKKPSIVPKTTNKTITLPGNNFVLSSKI